MNITGNTIFIPGSTSGIGLALALALALQQKGNTIIVGGRRGDVLDQLDPEPVTQFDPRGRIGTRIPHRWLDQTHTASTIDLAGPHWAVVTRGAPPSVPVLPGTRRTSSAAT